MRLAFGVLVLALAIAAPASARAESAWCRHHYCPTGPPVRPRPRVVPAGPCVPGPSCDPGPAERFPTWGNTPLADLGDCTFAAAADWSQIVLGEEMDPTLLGYEFAEAGGTALGLQEATFWSYWHSHGIAGVELAGATSYSLRQVDVENAVRDFRAVIVEFRWPAGWYFGTRRMPAGLHQAVVDGFTPIGPLVVTWGEVVQATWEQWRDEAVGMWGIAASVAPSPQS